jgi:LacI family transcriptional regulator
MKNFFSAQKASNNRKSVFDVIVPEDGSLPTALFADHIKFIAEQKRLSVRCHFINLRDSMRLEKVLLYCLESGTSGIAIHAIENEKIRAICLYASRLGVSITTIFSNFSELSFNYVGIDNINAGKTAAYLMSSHNRSNLPIAIIWSGGHSLADVEKYFGFKNYFSSINGLAPIVDIKCKSGHLDEIMGGINECLTFYNKLGGIYCAGSEILDTIRTFQTFRKRLNCLIVGHNLSNVTKNSILNDDVDIIIDAEIKSIAEKCLFFLSANPTSAINSYIPIRITTKDNINSHWK